MKCKILIIFLFGLNYSVSFGQINCGLGLDFFGNGNSSTLKKSSVAPYTYLANISIMPSLVLVNRLNIYGVIGYQRYNTKIEPLDYKTIVNTLESGIGLEYLNYKPKGKLTPLIGVKYLWFNEKIIEFSTRNLEDKRGFGIIEKIYVGYSYKVSPELFFNGQCEVMDRTYKSDFKGFDKFDIKVHITFGFRYLLK